MITVTDLARRKVLEVAEAENRKGHGLRVSVRNGGTSMVEYALNFVGQGEEEPGDTVIDVGEFKVHLDPDSARFLEGATLDYVDGLTESGFKVEAPNAGPPRPEGPVAEAVQKIIDERINPAVAMHGGFVSLVGLQDDVAYLRFGGGCQGCGMVDVTLRQGVEVMIKESVPQIARVMDVTDHASGKNPYYQPAK
jgi:Fe/S biogenesis protein NfuA